MWWSKELRHMTHTAVPGGLNEQYRVHHGIRQVSQTMVANLQDIAWMTTTDLVDRRVCYVLAYDPQSGQKRELLSFAA